MVAPTYNEADNIGMLVKRVEGARWQADFDLLVVDDNSPDGTADVVRGLQEDNPWLHLVVRPSRSGLGSAYRHGFRWGLARGYAFLGEIDADLSHDPKMVPTLKRTAAAGADLALGSRYICGGRTVGWPLRRKALSRAANLYARWLLGLRTQDVTGGFRVYRDTAVKRLLETSARCEGYGFQIEGVFALAQAGGQVTEVPITFREREIGVSKMSLAVAGEAARRCLQLAVERWRARLSRPVRRPWRRTNVGRQS